ncbi:MAG: YicC family protein [Planctomycetaceae bacterium]|nr:MAG: YicC family protein [Planctomycetaceae bacterium]
MLLSMTGHGEAQNQREHAMVRVEVRAVNNRFLKVSTRINEGFNALESRIEALIKQKIRRGTIQVNIRIEREPTPEDFRLNQAVLNGYRQQLQQMNQQWGIQQPVRLDQLLLLPGVVDEGAGTVTSVEDFWPWIESTLLQALEDLSQMRREEGAAMAMAIEANCQAITQQLEQIQQLAPTLAESYQQRLIDRVGKLLAEFEVKVKPAEVIREVAIYADRCDISEEIVRLRSHLEQFATVAAVEENCGRKLEFLIQELLREANTIGSKANDAGLARHVVEIKTAIERMREMIQNVE